MSREWDDEDEFEDEDDRQPQASGARESQLVKDLRKQIRQRDKSIEDLTEQVTTLGTKSRSADLKEVLSSKGANVKVASFYPSDRETTPEAVDEWLTANADVFGVTQTEDGQEGDDAPPAGDGLPPLTPETAALYRQLGATTASGQTPGSKPEELARGIGEAKTQEELLDFLAKH